MFAIEILLVGVPYEVILCRTTIFQVRRCQQIEFHAVDTYIETFAYFLSAFVNVVSLKF